MEKFLSEINNKKTEWFNKYPKTHSDDFFLSLDVEDLRLFLKYIAKSDECVFLTNQMILLKKFYGSKKSISRNEPGISVSLVCGNEVYYSEKEVYRLVVNKDFSDYENKCLTPDFEMEKFFKFTLEHLEYIKYNAVYEEMYMFAAFIRDVIKMRIEAGME